MTFKTLFYKYRNLFPVLILVAFELRNLYVIFFSTYTLNGVEITLSFTTAHIMGLVCLVLTLASWFWWKSYFMYVAACMLALGLFNIASFTPDTITWGFFVRIGSLRFSVYFQPLSFFIIVLYLLLYVDVLIGNKNSEQSVVSIPQSLDEKKVENFKIKYQNLSVEELNTIVQDKRYAREAIKAAEDLLNLNR